MSHGFIANQDIYNADDSWAYTGKVFGKLGIGKNSNPNYAKAFRSKIDSLKYNFMWVSVFPSKSSISSFKTIWDIKDVEVNNFSEIDAPSRPSAAEEPDSVRALFIAISMVTAAAVAASL